MGSGPAPTRAYYLSRLSYLMTPVTCWDATQRDRHVRDQRQDHRGAFIYLLYIYPSLFTVQHVVLSLHHHEWEKNTTYHLLLNFTQAKITSNANVKTALIQREKSRKYIERKFAHLSEAGAINRDMVVLTPHMSLMLLLYSPTAVPSMGRALL